ncbi:MAG: phage head closure protein [Pseudomonadota bacterium]
MNVGQLRRRLDIEQLNRVSDGAGGYATSWVNVDTVWAKVEPKIGRERLIAEQVSSRTNYDIVIRYRSDITAEMRFRDGTQVFHILSFFDENDQKSYLKCICEERKS